MGTRVQAAEPTGGEHQMSDEPAVATGGCMCGAVRYSASGAPVSVIHCHCLSCRRHTGAPVVTLVGFRKGQVSFDSGERGIYPSSPGVLRGFCGQCGTPLTWEGDGEELGPLIEIHISTLDAPNQFTPESHVHFDERIEWFDVADHLPRHHEWDEGKPLGHGPA
jgi:hypothetical protein